MYQINIGDVVSTIFILVILVTLIVVIIRIVAMMFAKNNQPSTHNNTSVVQQVDALTTRINRLEKQIEELQKKSL